MFEAAGWQVVTLKWGYAISALFERHGGQDLRQRLETMTNEEYQRLLRLDDADSAQRLIGPDGSEELRALVESLPLTEFAHALRDLGGHDPTTTRRS